MQCSKSARSSPGTCARTVSATVVIRGAPSTSSSVQAALITSRSGGVWFSPSTSASAIAKQVACAAAISSSGLVLPSGCSVRDAQVSAKLARAHRFRSTASRYRLRAVPPRGSRLVAWCYRHGYLLLRFEFHRGKGVHAALSAGGGLGDGVPGSIRRRSHANELHDHGGASPRTRQPYGQRYPDPDAREVVIARVRWPRRRRSCTRRTCRRGTPSTSAATS